MIHNIKIRLKKIYYQTRSCLLGILIPTPYKHEFNFFEDIRGNTYIDLSYKETQLRSMVHQLDKTLTLKKFKQMPITVEKIANHLDEVTKEPGHDTALAEWCRKLLHEYSARSNGNPSIDNLTTHFDGNEVKFLKSIIETRRSVRSYLPKPVSKESLHLILQSGLWAPTGCNRQTIEYLVIEDKTDIEYCQRIAGEGYPFPTEAPLAIVVLIDPRQYSLPSQRHMAYLEGGAAIQNMLLTAHTMGYGTCWLFWSGINVSQSQFVQKFSLNPWLLPIAMICLGHPNILPICRPERKEILKSIHYPMR